MPNRTKEILEKTIDSIKNDINEIKMTIETLHSSGNLTDDERNELLSKLNSGNEPIERDLWYLLMLCLLRSGLRK